MRNKLVFPNGGTETKYAWDRYSLTREGQHIWDKCKVNQETFYYWDKYAVKGQDSYTWDKYNAVIDEEKSKTTYTWEKYPTKKQNSGYIWYKRKFSRHQDRYIDFRGSSSVSVNSASGGSFTNGYIVFYYSAPVNETTTAPNQWNYFSVQDILDNNLQIKNLTAFGIYGWSWFETKPTSTSKPQYLVLSDGYSMTISNGAVKLSGNTYTSSKWPMGIIKNQNYSTDYLVYTLELDEIVDILYSNDISAYPINELKQDSSGAFYYQLITSPIAYDGGYYFDYPKYQRYVIDYNAEPETFISNSPTDYQIGFSTSENGYINDYSYFYRYLGESRDIVYLKGSTHYGEVVSSNYGQYPRDGEQDGYWYVLQVKSIYHWNKYNINVSKKYNWKKYSIDPIGEIGDTITAWAHYNHSDISLTFDKRFEAYKKPSSISDTIILDPDGDNTFTLYMLAYNANVYDGKISTKTVDLLDACEGIFKRIKQNSTIDYGNNVLECKGIPLGHTSNIIALKQNNKLWFVNGSTEILPTTDDGKTLNYNKLQIRYLASSSRYFKDRDDGLLPVPKSWGRYDSLYSKEGWTDTINIYGYYPGEPIRKQIWTKNQDGLWEDQDGIRDQDAMLYFISILNSNAKGTNFDTDYLTTCFGCSNRLMDYDKDSFKTSYRYFKDITFDLVPGKGDFISIVSSFDENAYPNGVDEENGYYYEYIGEEDVYTNEFIEEVESRDINDYPQDGEQDGYYYVYSHTTDDTLIKGDLIEQVENTDKNAYPNDKIVNDVWYVYSHSEIHYFCGIKIGIENSFDKNEYPVDGKLGDNWYVYVGYENNGPYKNYFIDQVETNQPTSYPTNGINGNYWYVYNKSYTGYKAQIFDNQIIGGINYQHNINPQSDATIGNVGMAKVDFTYDNTNDDFQQYIDLDYFLYYTWQKNDSDWRLIGKFFIDDVSYNRTRAKITAYDSICKAEKFVDDFIKQTTFPITLQAFYNNLLTYLGLENGGFKSLNMSDFSNLKQQIKDNFQAINITGRQILQYIAEMAGGYCLADKNGKIIIGDYSGKNTYPLNSSKYKKYEASKFEPERVRYVCAKMNTDDLGVAVGNADLGEEYIIENNPLFYTENEDEIKPVLINVLNLLYRYTGGYKPGTIELLEDFGIEVGDRVVIGKNYFYVMSKTMSASGCKLECFGNKHREKQAQSINSEIVALRGKTNELVRDLEKTQSTLTDTANGLQSQITQTASSIRSEVKSVHDGLSSSITQTASSIRSEVNDTKNELSSTIEQTASSITATVSDNKQELESKIEQTASSISSTVSQQGQVISQIKQDLDGISLTYNSEEGTASITIGDITISELVDGKYVDRVVAGIDFSGYCRFSDLSTPGQTIICGDNITTGTISADRIELTGSISWGDLSDSCQDTIASFAGSGGSGGEVPSYIKSTYIDATTIKSPTIYGAKIYAGTSAEGYIKLASTGMNFYSNSGGSVCGIGYYPGKYNLPYIMLGQGVNDAGTDKGMIKKYTNGIWIGDSDNVSSNSPGGTGIFINFTSGTIQKYINGKVSTL